MLTPALLSQDYLIPSDNEPDECLDDDTPVECLICTWKVLVAEVWLEKWTALHMDPCSAKAIRSRVSRQGK